MEVIRAYKAVLDPNCAQEQSMARHAGAARTTYNWALDEKMRAHQAYNAARAELTYTTFGHLPPDEALAAATAHVKKTKAYRIPTFMDLGRKLTRWRGDVETMTPGVFPWWRSVNRHALTTGLRNADAAWGNWIASRSGKRKGARMGYPRFKAKSRSRDSFAIYHDVKTPTIRLDDPRHLRIPTIGVVRCASNLRRLWRRLLKGTAQVQSVRISRHGKHWIAAIMVKETLPDPITTRAQRTQGAIGVDLGVTVLATLSTGEQIPNPRHLRDASVRLRKAQQALSRTQRRSSNHLKAIRRVATLHAQLAERRTSYLHQTTKRLATTWERVVLEDLAVSGMTRSARGTIDKPGRKVRQKAGLNREILDVSFAEFRRQIDYKTGWYGSELVVIDRWAPTSKTCSSCGAVDTTLTLAVRTYRCGSCGLVMDRDHNAARNIVRIGLSPDQARPTPCPDLVMAASSMLDTSDRGDSRSTPRDAYRDPTSPSGCKVNDVGRPPDPGSVTPREQSLGIPTQNTSAHGQNT